LFNEDPKVPRFFLHPFPASSHLLYQDFKTWRESARQKNWKSKKGTKTLKHWERKCSTNLEDL
jgi:hypothetical protein